MKTIIIPETEITPETDRRIKETLVTCFPRTAEHFSKSRAWNGCTAAQTVLIYEADAIIAGGALIDRAVLVNGKEFRTAGLGNIFTVPEHRGRGLAGRVVTACTDHALREGYGFGLLFCAPRVVPVYRKAGWHEVSGRRIISCGSPVPGPACTFPLRQELPVTGDIDLNGRSW